MRSLDKKPGQSSKPTKKDLRKRSELLTPSFTPEDLIRLGKQYAGLESPIDLSFSILTEAHLRPLEWTNFEKNPKRMKISNSGTTAILSAKWHGPRPYLTKGPLTGYYVFSQLHFHWGSSLEEGSEHTLDGRSLPLEVHVMFFKNTYLTQEDAMKQTDGTVTVAYLFILQNNDNEDLNPITSALKEIQKPLTSHHLELLPLEKFFPIFTEDYFMYWGNVVNRSILWLICRKPLGISPRQLSLFHSMTGINEKPITKNFRSTKEVNHRIVYHINASKLRNDLLIGIPRESRISNIKKNKAANQFGMKNVVGTGDEKPKNEEVLIEESEEQIAETQREESVLINVSLHGVDKSEKNTPFSGTETIEEVTSVHSSPSRNDAMTLEKRRKSQIKFQLASALLNLEKEEGNDYTFLEKYLQTKFDTFEQCYHTPSSNEKQGEDMLLPSIRSLQMNSYEDLETIVVSAIKDKSKSDTHCFKNYTTSGGESDLEKTSIGESKSGWSSMNSVSEKEDKGEEKISPSRPKTSTAKLMNPSSNLHNEAEEAVSKLVSSSKLSHPATPVERTTSNDPALQTRTPLSEKERTQKGTLKDNCKARDSKVDEARAKIRASIKQSLSRLGKMRGSPPKDLPKPPKPEIQLVRPAWRY